MNDGISWRVLLTLTVLVLAAAVASAEPAPTPEPGTTVYIQVETATVKAKPLGFTATVAMLPRGTPVVVNGPPTSGYLPVKFGEGKTGFVLETALVTKERYKEIEKESVGAKETGESYAAHGAAKGWDSATEKEYAKKKNYDAEFKTVDKIAAGPFPGRSVADLEKIILQFASEGRLGEAAISQ
jgi:hypothetical protein